MIVFPHCKINLGLFVTGRRDDGFHNIESIFLPVKRVNDILEVILSDEDTFELTNTGIAVDGAVQENICFKAWALLRREKNIGGVKCHLHKIIPAGAGLGGGSADGAFMLTALNELFELHLGTDELKSFALQLGSDCPFFLDAQASFVSGRGESIAPIQIDLKGIYIAIVHPGIHVNTGVAYAMLSPRPAPFDLRTTGELNRNLWPERITNDFEIPVMQKHPEIAEIKHAMIRSGAFYTSMSGSGSAVYALYNEEPDLPDFPSSYAVFKALL